MNVISLDAPTEGWNAFDSMDNMPPTAAVILNNFIPGAGRVDTRKGHIIYADLETGEPVDTLASYNPSTDTAKLLAASAGGIWELTDPPAAYKADLVGQQAIAIDELKPIGTYANSQWQFANFQKADEIGIMTFCNGVDTTQIYNGTTIIDINITGTDPVLELDPTFIGCLTFKGRMYYWLPEDNAFYYAQAGSYQGELQRFDLGTFVQQGGFITTVFSWTQQDAGHGRDDFIVFVFSTGEVLVYQGDDPQTAGYWEQVGRYRTAEPLSIRGYVNYGADAILMTKDGYVSMASVIQEGRTSDVPAFSRLIHEAVIERTRYSLNIYGWDVVLFQREGLLLFNIPLSETTYEQHVMNTVTMRWCRFNSLDTRCLEVHEERLFGGSPDGKVLALLETTADNDRPITFDCLYAFNYLSDPGYRKHVTAAQILSTHSNPQEINVSAWADYNVPYLSPIDLPSAITSATWSPTPPDPPPAPQPLAGSFWDTDYWSGEGVPFTSKGWQNVSALGYAVALLVRFAKINESVIWRSTGVRFHQIGAQ